LQQLAGSELELTVACSSEAVLMVEASANELSEDRMVEAIEFAQKELAPVIKLISDMREQTGHPKKGFEPAVSVSDELSAQVSDLAREAGLATALVTGAKAERAAGVKALRQGIIDRLVTDKDAPEAGE